MTNPFHRNWDYPKPRENDVAGATSEIREVAEYEARSDKIKREQRGVEGRENKKGRQKEKGNKNIPQPRKVNNHWLQPCLQDTVGPVGPSVSHVCTTK